jgi:drug/metabolite transporter (DMT)-like permease
VREKYLGRYGVQAALVGLAAIWGGTFVVVAESIKLYPMYGFLAWRFGVASVAFVLFYPRIFRKLDVPNLTWGLLAGVFLSAGYIFQTWGLDGVTATTPARAAFITGLYVILTPLFQAVLLRKVPRKSTLLGAAIALGGLWLLSGIGQASGGWVLGDTLVVICAVAYSIHMIVLGSTSEGHDVMALTFVQLVTVTAVCTVISAIKEQPGLPTNPAVIWSILLTGVLASALAFVIQTWAQSKLPPARVALILVMEPAFGGAIGWAVAGLWPLREVLGAAAMLSGMVVSEVVAAMAPASEGIAFGPAVEGMPAPVAESRSGASATVAEEGSNGG